MVLFSINQMLYPLIAMWIYPVIPEKMPMVIAIIFGAHLIPYCWLYVSRTYMVLHVFIPIAALFIELHFWPFVLATAMNAVEIIFILCLIYKKYENKKLRPLQPYFESNNRAFTVAQA